MSLITGSIKDVLSIKLKQRDDDYTDQFSRIFMVKMFVISSLIMSVDYFSDKVNCIIPKGSHLTRDFVHSVCWIQGFYIYEELKSRMSESGYYGIPKDTEIDGKFANGQLCRQFNKATYRFDEKCNPLTRAYYLQYQYFPFFIASLAIMYYMPYILFRIVNDDLIRLKGYLKRANGKPVDTKNILDNYFQYSKNGGKLRLRLKTVLNVAIKISYVGVSVLGFALTNMLLQGNYMRYGLEWMEWTKLNNTVAFQYNPYRKTPKPGDILLPSMGFCDIVEGSNDVRSTFTNHHKFICEISPNVLYQYVLVVLWYLFVISIAITVFGVLLYIVSSLVVLYGYSTCFNRVNSDLANICDNMTFREIEYLRFIRIKDLSVYGDVVKLLQKQRYHYCNNADYDTEQTLCKETNFISDGNMLNHNSVNNINYR